MGSTKSKHAIKNKTRNITDWHLWSEVTRSVSPLPRRINPSPKICRSAKKLSSAEESQKRHLAAQLTRKYHNTHKVSWSPNHANSSHPAILANHLSGIEPRLRKKVRRGQLPIDATIDLHGLRQDEARSALYRFIENRWQIGDRTLLVITGKGLKKVGYGAIEQKGVLRHLLPVWLKEVSLAPLIAGFEVSSRQHGGEGAYYVRLKRGRQ